MHRLSFLLAFVFSTLTFAETTPCSKHPGRGYTNEGTGLCTGNNTLKIALGAVGFSLIYNSQASDTGYGPGWNLSADSSFVKTTSSAGILYLEDGTPLNFTKSGSNWVSSFRALYDDVLTEPTSTTMRQTNLDGSVFNYTKVGTTNRYVLTSVTSRKGTELVIARNAAGLITQMTNFFGRITPLTYDAAGKLATVKDYMGATYTFAYTGANLTGVTYPDGITISLAYNASNQLISYTDSKGRQTSYTYLGSGATSVLSSMTDHEGFVTNYTYDSDSVEAQGFGLSLIEVFTPNGSSLTVASTQDGLTKTEVFDSQKRITQSKNPFAEVTTYIYSGTNPKPQEVRYADGTKVVYTYNSKNSITQEIFSAGTVAVTRAYIRNTNGQVTRLTTTGPTGLTAVQNFTYDSKGNMTLALDAANKTAFSASYNAQSLMTSQTNLQGETANYVYDAFGNSTSSTYGSGDSETRTFNAIGAILSMAKVPQNFSSNYTYDIMGRPTVRARQVTGASGNIKWFSNGTFSPLSSSVSSQEIFNDLLLRQDNGNYDSKYRPLYLERSAAPY